MYLYPHHANKLDHYDTDFVRFVEVCWDKGNLREESLRNHLTFVMQYFQGCYGDVWWESIYAIAMSTELIPKQIICTIITEEPVSNIF